MKRILSIFILGILFLGCTNSNNNLTNTYDNNKLANTYNYYNYTLNVSDEMKSKLYIWTSAESNIENEKLYTLNGKVDNEKFVISDKTPLPSYFRNFDNKVEVIKIKFKPTESTLKDFKNGAKDGKGFESTLIGGTMTTVFNAFKDVKFGEAVTLAYYEEKKGLKIDLFKYSKNDNNEYIINNPFKANKVQNIELNVMELKATYKDKSKDYFYDFDEVSFYIKDYSVENDIVRDNLVNNPNNEELVKVVAKNDPSFFRVLQSERGRYNLDSKSILRLPNDVNIEYALNNLNEIINTSEYLSTSNTFKKIDNISTLFPDLKDVKKTVNSDNFIYKNVLDRNKIENKSKQVDVSNKDFKENNTKKSGFVDLDNGI